MIRRTAPPKQFSWFTWFMISWLATSGLMVIVGLPKPLTPARAAGEKMLLLWDTALGGSVPTGWTNASATYGGFFLRGDTVANVGVTNLGVHTHTNSTVAFQNASTPTVSSTSNKTTTTVAAAPHGHSISLFAMEDTTILPVYRNLIAITYDSGIPTTLPQYAIAIFDSGVAATGFSDYTAQDGSMIRIDSTSGGTGGATTHTHANFRIVSDAANSTVQRKSGSGATVILDTHTHTYGPTNSPASTDHTPLHTEVDLRYVTSSGGTAIPAGMIAMFNGDPNIDSSNWDIISDASEAFGGVYIEAQTTYATGQGNATHNHTLSASSSTYAADTAMSGSNPTSTSIDTHSHTISGDFSTENNVAPYINVVVAKKQAAYTPQMNNWRWYADEEDETPNTPYAAETTGSTPNEPPTVEMGKRIPLKLRINITETSGVTGENDSRKVLQWSTNQSTWTSVTEAGLGNPTIPFVYTTDISGGDDNVAITTQKLTGTTQSGIHNESNSNSPSNSDHTAGATLELEYAFETYDGVSTATAYYFQLYDQVLAAAIPLASGKCYPKLTTASAFDLSILGPNDIAFGDFTLGNPPPHIHKFTAGEKFTARDNRGVMGDGWTLSADITTLTSGSYTISDSDIYWVSYTTDVTPLYDAPTTGISGNTGQYMTGSVTVTSFSASGRNGHGGFEVLPEVRIYNMQYMGDYTGNLVLTVA